MNGIYKFSQYCGRMGDLEGVFVASSDDVAKLMGTDVHMGEVLGKHSDVSVVISENNLKLVTDNEEFVKIFCDLGLSSGINPMDYYDEEEE